jgi:hypothetical protein
MNLARGLLRLWIVVSVIWSCVVGGVIYSMWPAPLPVPSTGLFDDIIPSVEAQREALSIKGGAAILLGPGLLLLGGLAAAWVIRGFRKVP